MINWLWFCFSLVVKAVQDLPTALTKLLSKHCSASQLLPTVFKKTALIFFGMQNDLICDVLK